MRRTFPEHVAQALSLTLAEASSIIAGSAAMAMLADGEGAWGFRAMCIERSRDLLTPAQGEDLDPVVRGYQVGRANAIYDLPNTLAMWTESLDQMLGDWKRQNEEEGT